LIEVGRQKSPCDWMIGWRPPRKSSKKFSAHRFVVCAAVTVGIAKFFTMFWI
jgi:hypothetical protein